MISVDDEPLAPERRPLGSGESRPAVVLAGANVVTPDGVLESGWVEIREGVITGVGSGRPPAGPVTDLGGAWLLPGFVDLHVHGGGGHDMAASSDGLLAAVDFHRRHGTTRTLTSLVTAPVEDLVEQLMRVADVVESGRCPSLLGAHLEGPFLARERRGAHQTADLREPDLEVWRSLHRAGRGHLRVITLAPELRGALDLIQNVVDAGVVAALGHSDAGYDQARAGIAAGATLITHLFNGMRPFHHRDPGLIGAAFDTSVAVELIVDGVHLHPGAARLAAHGGKAVLVTDAMAAAGRGDGDYQLGEQLVEVRCGAARVRDTGSLAGSVLTMDAAFRHAVSDVGMSIPAASRAVSGAPAAVLGLEQRFGSIRPGLAADLVVLDDQLAVTHVLSAGAAVR